MSAEQTTNHQAVEDSQREDGLSPDVMTDSTSDTSEAPKLPYDAQGTSTMKEGIAMSRTESSSHPVGDGIGELVCGMLCYLNIIPIISRHLQTETTGDESRDPPSVDDTLPYKSEIERELELQEKLNEEIQLQKDVLKNQKCQLRGAFWNTKRVEGNNQHLRRNLAESRTRLNNKEVELEAAKNLIKFQEDDLREAEATEADRRWLYTEMKELRPHYRKAHYSSVAAVADLYKAAECESVAEQEISELRLKLEESEERERVQQATNYDLYMEMTNKVTGMEEEIRKVRLELEWSEEREKAQQATNYDLYMEMTKKDRAMEEEIGKLSLALDETAEREEKLKLANHDICSDWREMKSRVNDMETANQELYNGLQEAAGRFIQVEAERDELRNACLALLVENRRLQANQPGMFRRIRDATY